MFPRFIEHIERFCAGIQAADRALTLTNMAREGTHMGLVIKRYEDLTLRELEEFARFHLDPTGHQTDLPDGAVRAVTAGYIDDIRDLRPDIGQRLDVEFQRHTPSLPE